MAKGRNLTISRSERFLGSAGYYQGHETVTGSPELREDEVWSTVDGTGSSGTSFGSGSGGEWNTRGASNGGGAHHNQGHPPRVDHHRRRQVGGLSLAFDESNKKSSSSPRIVHQFSRQDSIVESPRGRHMATSAPMEVPDWSKIYRVESVESMHDSDDDVGDDGSEWVPPHEYLARSRRSAANSMFEGVGRTLKGRDLSRVRDAVWSQTGFDG